MNQYSKYEEDYNEIEENAIDETSVYNDGEDKKPKLILMIIGIVLLIIILLIILFACSKISNNKTSTLLSELKISDATIVPGFDKNTFEYDVETEKDSVIIRCNAESSKASTSGCNKQIYLSDVCQRHTIKVMANGSEPKEYVLNLCKKSSEAPIIKEIIVNPTEYTNKQVKVIIEAESDTHLHSAAYSIDDGTSWQESNEFIVTENKTLKIKVRNKEGVETATTVEIKNIDNTKPSVKIEGSVKSGASTTSNVQLTAEVTPDTVVSGYKYQWYNNNKKISGATKVSYLATTSGDYKVEVTTGSGNVATSATYKVSIKKYNNSSNNNSSNNNNNTSDKDVYTLGIVSVDGNPTAWTNQNVTLTVKTKSSNGLHSQAYSFDGGKTYQASNSKSFTSNQSVKIVVRDKKNNKTEYNVKITKIDKTKPVISVTGTKYTGDAITAAVTPSTTASGYKYQWYKDGKVITGATSKVYTPSASGTYKVVVTTGSGVSTEFSNIKITNKVVPTITLTSTSTSGNWTNSNVKLTATVKNGTATKYEWYKGTSLYSSCTSSSCTLSTTQSATYKVRAVMSDGSKTSFSSTFTVKIDKTVPTTPTIVLSSTTETSSNVTFKITSGKDSDSGISKVQYSYDNATWKNYTEGSSVTLLKTTGTKKVYARTVDKVNNVSETVNATGKCDKDEVKTSRNSNGCNSTGCWFILNLSLTNTGLSGITDDKFEYAYWNATNTTHTTNQESSLAKTKCGTTPPSNAIRTTTSGKTIALYQKYNKQYSCFASRPYRSKEISGINRWTIEWKLANTVGNVNSSAYNGK